MRLVMTRDKASFHGRHYQLEEASYHPPCKNRTHRSEGRAGFGYVIAEWPSEGKARLEEFVEKVMPGIAAS